MLVTNKIEPSFWLDNQCSAVAEALSALPVLPSPIPPSLVPMIRTMAAASNINGFKLVALRGDGVHLANIATDSFLAVGISSSSALVGEGVNIVTSGACEYSGWDWIPGLPIFASTVAGELTQTPDSLVYLVQVATAITPKMIWVKIEQPIKLVS